MNDPDAWSVAAGCAAEAYAVGRASGVNLGFDEPVAYVRAFGEKIPGARPSMLLDYLAGRRTEIDFINGAIPRAGREVGVATPLNDTVTALVKALERR
jgi:2-dehydropantoate 2-reductase